MTASPIPVIDLFSGPGGLGEGFEVASDSPCSKAFEIVGSFEKDTYSCQTLRFRRAQRRLVGTPHQNTILDILENRITPTEALLSVPGFSEAYSSVTSDVHEIELGPSSHELVDREISKALHGKSHWVLIGGPPCQAYSIAGRSRMRPVDPEKFAKDSRHSLYKEYLRIIEKFKPSVFVMENVKGLLTAKLNGESTFGLISNDLRNACGPDTYMLRSIVSRDRSPNLDDFLVESEKYGIPQRRHRVIIIGVRRDICASPNFHNARDDFYLQPHSRLMSVRESISDLPKIRSALSLARGSHHEVGTHRNWLAALKRSISSLTLWRSPLRDRIEREMMQSIRRAEEIRSLGNPYIPADRSSDRSLGGTLNHESRLHMESDLHRYLFIASFARVTGYSPKLPDLPPKLLPNHLNIRFSDSVPFLDRFKVHASSKPSGTITSHISKDGHANIHYDPAQCRSLTVREAARLQTFPDDYLFLGPRTQQYKQVGNAVPPKLALQIARIVQAILST